jgi:hypothetical protein
MNMDSSANVSASPVAPQEAAPASVPFSAGVNQSEVSVRVDFALREQ